MVIKESAFQGTFFFKATLKLFVEVEIFMSKSFQIFDSKYKTDYLEIYFKYIGSTKLITGLLVLTTGVEVKVYTGDR